MKKIEKEKLNCFVTKCVGIETDQGVLTFEKTQKESVDRNDKSLSINNELHRV